jgi:hypothetical protein
MIKTKSYENYPLWMIILSNILSLSIYAIGTYVLLGLSVLFAALYLLYCIWAEYRLLSMSCVNCYYYGKFCCFGQGKLCSLFFKKGNMKNFNKRKITAKDMLPDFLVSVFPILGVIIILITNFSWNILIALLVLLILTFAGNAFIRGSFACKYCKQRMLGCPAEKFFGKK